MKPMIIIYLFTLKTCFINLKFVMILSKKTVLYKKDHFPLAVQVVEYSLVPTFFSVLGLIKFYCTYKNKGYNSLRPPFAS